MTVEQLQAERAKRWRHAANPLLTAEDAREWLNAAGLCLYLPRPHQFLAPAPTFAEAIAGAITETPSREMLENAAALMHRLVADGAILPLNLFGSPSEMPDFLVTVDAFPYLFSLRGTRDWKTVPGGKASPLVVEIWKLLEKESGQTAAELQSALGREITEAAVLRGLMELWSNLRVMPEYKGSAPTRWSLSQARFKDALTAGGKLSQTTALSALVSLYLESVIAATSEEIETFLSPLTARSKVRDTVNGLSATRQISMTPVATHSMFHIAGALPEFPEPVLPEAVPATGAETTTTRRTFDRAPTTGREPVSRERIGRDRGDRAPRSFERKPAPFNKKPGERKSFGSKAGERGGFPSRDRDRESSGDRPQRRTGTKPTGYERTGGEGKTFNRKPFDKSARPFSREDKPARGGPRSSDERRGGFRKEGPSGKFPPKKFGFRKDSGQRSGFKPGGGFGPDRSAKDGPAKDRPSRSFASGEDSNKRPRTDRPFTPRREGTADRFARGPQQGDRPKRSAFGSKGRFADDASSRPKSSGDRGPSRPKFGGPKSGGPKFGGPKFGGPKAGTPASGKRSFSKPKFGGKPGSADGEKRPFFRKRPESAGPGDERRPSSSPREASSEPRFGSGRPKSSFSHPGSPGAGRSGAWKGKPEGGSFKSKPFGEKKNFGDRKSFGSKSAGGTKKFGGAGKFGAGNFKPRKPGGKPGGARPPFRKRKDEGGTSAE